MIVPSPHIPGSVCLKSCNYITVAQRVIKSQNRGKTLSTQPDILNIAPIALRFRVCLTR